VDFCNQLTTIQGLENCPYLKEIYVDQCPNLQPPYTFLEAWKEEIAQLKAQLAEYRQQKVNRVIEDVNNFFTGRNPKGRETELLEKIKVLENQISQLQAPQIAQQTN